MSDRSTLRGSRLGALSYEDERNVVFADRQEVSYRCPEGHVVRKTWSIEAEVPDRWECETPRCSEMAVRLDGDVAEPKPTKPARTHWDMLLERHSVGELEDLLEERLTLLRAGQAAAGSPDAPHVSPTVKTRRGRKTA
jgi:hypothetical protein